MKVIVEKIKIPQLTGNIERRLYIRLPENYDYSDQHYPVLYMFDGHNVFLILMQHMEKAGEWASI